MYRSKVLPPPSVKRVQALSQGLKLDLTDSEVNEITECLGGFLDKYEDVYRMTEPKPPVNYPRKPGYIPPPEENPFNAWYVKTDIQGANEGKLFGKTVAIKDNICVAGVQMMNGSKMLEGYIPSYDATVVTRVLDAGGRILGKSACENFCFSGGSFTNDMNPVLNPIKPTHTSGGSSSGSATLLAANEVDLAIGGDQGGSIRIPASFCGVVGLKPTFGLVPFTGASPIEPTVDHLGPMAKNVFDCALFLEVLAGYDGMDYRQPETFPTLPEYSKKLNADLNGKRIGLLKEGFDGCKPEVIDIVKKAGESLTALGAIVQEVSLPMHSEGQAIWTPIIMDGAFDTMVNRGSFGPSAKGFHDSHMMDHLTNSMRHSLNNASMPFKTVCILGQYLKDSNNYHYYCRASNLTMKLTKAYDEKLKDYDVLIMPTLPFVAPKIPQQDASLKEMLESAFAMVQNTAPFDATGHPALSINSGHVDGLPVGMLIVGRKWHDQDVLNVAYAYEKLST